MAVEAMTECDFNHIQSSGALFDYFGDLDKSYFYSPALFHQLGLRALVCRCIEPASRLEVTGDEDQQLATGLIPVPYEGTKETAESVVGFLFG